MKTLRKYLQWRLFGGNKMARNLLQMTKEIFNVLELGVQQNHKDFIADVNRHIIIDSQYRDSACELLKKANIDGLDLAFPLTVAFINYQEQQYLCVDSRYADVIEKNGYKLEERKDVVIGSKLLCLATNLCHLKVDSERIIDSCLGIQSEVEKEDVVFTPEDILSLVYDLTVFKLNEEENELELSFDYHEDLYRIFILIYLDRDDIKVISGKSFLMNLACKSLSRKVCSNIVDFLNISDNKMKFLTLYHCIEFLFIPTRASAFKTNYHMNMADAVKLHIDGAARKDERGSVISVLKEFASDTVIEKCYHDLCGEGDAEKRTEKLGNWIYDLRCLIAHFRYGQHREEIVQDWNIVFERMLELVDSLYENLDQEIQDLCKYS